VTPEGTDAVERDFTVAVFVVDRRRVLLHYHQKLNRWLPPGGHIEPGELPDEAALREVLEETGIVASLAGEQLNAVALPGQPRQLCRPAGMQLADIRPGHQHIDLIYFAIAESGDPLPGSGWFASDDWKSLDLTAEVETWCRLAIAHVDRQAPAESRVRTSSRSPQ
jgi:8-oxo-dGTP pyrophosphatase MutT (NUDIX family)